MDLAEVLTFSREYINFPGARTAERKQVIRAAIRQLTGEQLTESCGTCYIEAIFKILNHLKMSKYELKRGYTAEFSAAYKGIKSFTNRNLEMNPELYDRVAEEFLKQNPERVIFFVRTEGFKPVGRIPENIHFITPSNHVPQPPAVNIEQMVRSVEAKSAVPVDKPVDKPVQKIVRKTKKSAKK